MAEYRYSNVHDRLVRRLLTEVLTGEAYARAASVRHEDDFNRYLGERGDVHYAVRRTPRTYTIEIVSDRDYDDLLPYADVEEARAQLVAACRASDDAAGHLERIGVALVQLSDDIARGRVK